MEPSFNPALEAQAIGRVYRLGQKRPVEILKLVMKGSFEERMVKFLKKKFGKDSKERKSNEASENEQKKDSSEKKTSTVAGNLNTDKVELVTEEFDILFGVKDRLAAEPKGGDENIKPDGTQSIGNV